MPDSLQTLIRKLTVKPEMVKKGLFSKESRNVLDGAVVDGEKIFGICLNGCAEEVDPKNLPSKDGIRFFAVQCDPFDLFFRIPLGQEKDGFHWYLEIGGKAKIKKQKAFLEQYYSDAKVAPFTTSAFVKALGTVPKNLLLDEILNASMEVLKLKDLKVDMEDWASERNLTEMVFTNALSAKDGTPFFVDGDKGAVVEFVVRSVKFVSPERDYAIKSQNANTDSLVKAEQDRIKKQEQAAQVKRDNDAKREEELAQKIHELKIAELDAQKNKLQCGDIEAAFAAFEMISNVLGDTVAKSGSGSFVELLKDAKRAESGLRLLALVKDKSKEGGVTLAKNAPSFSTRTIGVRDRSLEPITAKTPVLHYNETLSSTIFCERHEGYLTILNVSECNEIVPLLPNRDFPEDVRIAQGERMLVADESCQMLSGLRESASSGTDHLVALVTDNPLLSKTLPKLGEALSPAEATDLVAKLTGMNKCQWAADVNSYLILP